MGMPKNLLYSTRVNRDSYEANHAMGNSDSGLLYKIYQKPGILFMEYSGDIYKKIKNFYTGT